MTWDYTQDCVVLDNKYYHIPASCYYKDCDDNQ